MNKAAIGTLIHATMRNEDLIPTFADELERLDDEKQYASLAKEAKDIVDYDSEEAAEVLEELFNALNEFAPPYFYFGAHPSDGSDYGYWLSECMSEDFDGLKVSDLSEVPDSYNDEVLSVNDHGNMTLYSCENGNLTEVWGIV